MRYRSSFGMLVAGLLAACGPTLNVKTDYDQLANFNQFRTYRLEQGQLVGERLSGNTLVKDRIDGALRAQLRGEGLAPTARDPDLVVRYSAGARTVQELYSSGWPAFPYYGYEYGVFGPADAYVAEVPEGMLVIDLVDAHTEKLVWRAYVRAEGEGFTRPEFIQKAVARAFEKYPPRA